MKNLQFSAVVANRRKEMGLKQEQVAQYIGVSRAAVSKWEKGLSYPDITLLPKLATYFNISIDALLGYEPQMTKERIGKTYADLARQFSEQPFEEVQKEIEQLLAEYYSCFPFVLKMAQLYLNYHPQAIDQQQVLNRILELSERVKEYSGDHLLINEAVMFEAYVKLVQGAPAEVLEILGENVYIELGADQLIATAHQMLGDVKKAKEILQVSHYQHVIATIGNAAESLPLEVLNESHFDEIVHRMQEMIRLFQVEQLNVNTALVFYLKAAMGYAMQNHTEKALEMIEVYCQICYRLEFPLRLQGDNYFYLLSDWIEDKIQTCGQAPRDDLSIKKDLVKTMANNPAFESLYGHPTYKSLMSNLKHHLHIEEEL